MLAMNTATYDVFLYTLYTTISLAEPHQSSNKKGWIIAGAIIGPVVVSIAVAIVLCIVLKKCCPRERQVIVFDHHLRLIIPK